MNLIDGTSVSLSSPLNEKVERSLQPLATRTGEIRDPLDVGSKASSSLVPQVAFAPSAGISNFSTVQVLPGNSSALGIPAQPLTTPPTVKTAAIASVVTPPPFVSAVPTVQVLPSNLAALGIPDQPLPIVKTIAIGAAAQVPLAPVVASAPSSVPASALLPTDVPLTGQFVFIDSSLPNYKSLVDGVNAGVNVVTLDYRRDGIAQITQVLAQAKNVSAVHIVSLGDAGVFKLGAAQVNTNSLDIYKRSIQKWTTSFAPNAEILLYGSNIGAGVAGASFTQKLSKIAQASVAASNNQTGKNGDWVLEVNTSEIATKVAFQSSLTSTYAANFNLV